MLSSLSRCGYYETKLPELKKKKKNLREVQCCAFSLDCGCSAFCFHKAEFDTWWPAYLHRKKSNIGLLKSEYCRGVFSCSGLEPMKLGHS